MTSRRVVEKVLLGYGFAQEYLDTLDDLGLVELYEKIAKEK